MTERRPVRVGQLRRDRGCLYVVTSIVTDGLVRIAPAQNLMRGTAIRAYALEQDEVVSDVER